MRESRSAKLIVLAVLIILAAGLYGLVHARAYSSVLTIEVVPSDSTVTLNGKVIAQGVLHLKPGIYNVKASRSGFASDSRNVKTSKSSAQYAGIALLSNSPATAGYYANHPADRKKAEGISSKSFDANSEQQTTASPFILKLPFMAPGLEFKIDYGAPTTASGGKPVIYIQAASDTAKQDALIWIKHQGFDPSKMYIVYTSS